MARVSGLIRGIVRLDRVSRDRHRGGAELKLKRLLGAISARYRVSGARLDSLLGSWAPSELSVSLTGRNLFTVTGYSGMDVEAGTPAFRMEGYEHPGLRTIIAAIEVTL